MRALNPGTGNLLFAEEEHFDKKDEFFEKADALARAVRKDLGESLGAVETTSRPLAKVTTTSIEALQFYSKAKEAMDQGREEQALPLLQSALQLDPDFAMAHLLLGQYYSAVVGKNQNATAELKRAYDLRGGVTDREQRRIEAAYFNIQERYDEEARALSALVSLYPDDRDAHLELSNALYFSSGQIDAAINELAQVLRLDPYSARAYSRCMVLLAHKNSAQQAIDLFKMAQQRGVEFPRMHWAVGLAYLGQGNVPQARQEFGILAAREGPDHALGQLYLIRTDLYEGKWSVARRALQAKLRADDFGGDEGFGVVRHRLLAELAILLGDLQSAVREADFMMKIPQAALQTEDIRVTGVIYARTGQIGPATQLLRRLDAIRTNIPTSWNRSGHLNLLGELALAEGKHDEAINAFYAAESEYSRAANHYGLARAYESQHDWMHAAQEWQQVLAHKGEIFESEFPPDLVVAHLRTAQAYRAMHDLSGAKDQYEATRALWQGAEDSLLTRQLAQDLQAVRKDSKKLNSATDGGF